MKRLGTARVLLIEDDPAQAFVVRELLEEATGVTGLVTHVSRLADAIAALGTHAFDVALLDLGLPDSSGLASLERLRHAAPELPVVVVTGLDDDDLGVAALKGGAQDYLVKGHVEPLLLARSLRYAIERAQAERALARERRLLQTLVKSIPDLVWLKDAAGVYVNANPSFEAFMGKSERELLGHTDFDLVDADLAESFRANDQLAILAGGPRLNEVGDLRRRRPPRPPRDHQDPDVRRPAAPDQVLGIAREITERARATEELRLATENMEAAQRLARFGSWELDIDIFAAPERDPMRWSDECYRIFG
ncbi:MAG: response regulator [Deltaproteobacteria bacterium]|nr:response regulator [Deltaproteobacteria bacterium]